MLNHDEQTDWRIVPGTKWCVGEPPLRCDVGLGARLAETIRQLFWRDKGERAIPMRALPQVDAAPKRVRKAA